MKIFIMILTFPLSLFALPYFLLQGKEKEEEA